MTAPQDPFAAPDPSARLGGPDAGATPDPFAAPAYGAAATFGEPVSGRPPYAPWIQRVGATLIDSVITIAVVAVFAAVSQDLGNAVQLVIFLLFVYLLGSTGQTPGKKALGIKVLREADGQPLGFAVALGRAIAHILDALPLMLGFLWPLWDEKKQTFADKIVKSVAVRA